MCESRSVNTVLDHLKTLGIARLAEWDVLMFIYRHGTSLADAERLARLLGYNRAAVGAALDTLTSSGLVQRSRNSNGIRLYRFADGIPDESRRRALEELTKLADERRGRLLLVRSLPETARDKELRARGGLHLA
jgi:DNA-binding IclR family transcriptional regulator